MAQTSGGEPAARSEHIRKYVSDESTKQTRPAAGLAKGGSYEIALTQRRGATQSRLTCSGVYHPRLKTLNARSLAVRWIFTCSALPPVQTLWKSGCCPIASN